MIWNWVLDFFGLIWVCEFSSYHVSVKRKKIKDCSADEISLDRSSDAFPEEVVDQELQVGVLGASQVQETRVGHRRKVGSDGLEAEKHKNVKWIDWLISLSAKNRNWERRNLWLFLRKKDRWIRTIRSFQSSPSSSRPTRPSWQSFRTRRQSATSQSCCRALVNPEKIIFFT